MGKSNIFIQHVGTVAGLTAGTTSIISTLTNAPGLSAASTVLKQISQQCEAAVWNKERFRAIGVQSQMFLAKMKDQEAKTGTNERHEALDNLMKEYCNDLACIVIVCEKYGRKKTVKLMFRPNKVTNALTECKERLDMAYSNFVLGSSVIMQRSQKRLEDGQNQVLRNQTSMRDAHVKLKSDTADIKDGQGHIRQTTDTLLDCVTTILDLSEATKQALDGALEANTKKMLSEFIEKNPLAAHEILETRQNWPELPEDLKSKYGAMMKAIIDNGGGRYEDLSQQVTMITQPNGAIDAYDKVDVKKKYWIRQVARTPMIQGSGQDKAKRRFEREMLLGAGLTHGNILKLLGFVHKGTDVYMVSHYEEYIPMDKYIQRNPNENPAGLLSQVACGLEFLHSQPDPMVHGDMRCSKVVVNPSGTPKIFDFTLSVVIAEVIAGTKDSLHTNVTSSASEYWQAPEILIASHNQMVSPTTMSDVWSFAVTMIEVLIVEEDMSRSDDRHPYHWIRRTNHLIEMYRNFLGKQTDEPFPYDSPPTNDYAKRWGTKELWSIIGDCQKGRPEARLTIKQVEARLRLVDGSGLFA